MLPRLAPETFPSRLYPLAEYLPLLPLALAIWGVLLLRSGRYRSHRTVPLLDEAWAIIRVCLSGAVALHPGPLRRPGGRAAASATTGSAASGSCSSPSSACLFLLTEKLALRMTSRYVRLARLQLPHRADRGHEPHGPADRRLDPRPPLLGLPHPRLHRATATRPPEPWPSRYPILGEMADIPRIVESNVVDDVIFAVHRRELDRLEDLFLSLQEQGIRTRFAMDLFPHTRARVELEELDGMPLLSFATTPTSQLQLMAKRVLDVARGLAPAPPRPAHRGALIALAIKLISGGNVLFRQTRCGLNGRFFTLYKFRTMVEDAEERRRELLHLNEMKGPVFKLRSDPRVTALGRLPAPLQPGRAAAVLERAARRHEPGGAAPADPRGGGPVPALAAPPAGDEAGPHLSLAGQRAQRPRLRALDAARPRVHRLLVAHARSEDPAEDDPGGAVGEGRVVGRLAGKQGQ